MPFALRNVILTGIPVYVVGHNVGTLQTPSDWLLRDVLPAVHGLQWYVSLTQMYRSINIQQR